ncbi:hypothetical protein [Nocardioides pinisoli]|uniref:Uncharacterized protein n=1 Tax=Nocardioides pinisoli TaxID=2950279 RepID=A0ABT1L114_9ACTN|nr:hypothetical protein [Nocardioides pinisoli]MCP3423707.1 hypothetical protein [Nocardioides pinisoli]
MQRYERLWERLLTLLGTLGEVDSSTPGRLRLTVDRHDVEIVMTEAEWDELVRIPHGSFAGGALHLLHALSRAQSIDAPFLVYDTYELHASATPRSPLRAEMEADRRRVEEYLRTHPGAKVQWRAFPPGSEPT